MALENNDRSGAPGAVQPASAGLACDFLRSAETAFAEATERFERYLSGMNDRSANWSPLPGTWSVAGNIEHLVKGSELYFAKMIPALESARDAGWTGNAPYGRGTFVGRMILGVLDPGRPRFKAVKTVRGFAPRTGPIEYAEVCDRFRAVQRRWPEVLRLADGLDLGRIRIATPSRRCSASAWRRRSRSTRGTNRAISSRRSELPPIPVSPPRGYRDLYVFN